MLAQFRQFRDRVIRVQGREAVIANPSSDRSVLELMKTSTFTVNNLSSPEAVVCTVACRSITIGEDPSVSNWPTTDYNIYGKDPGSTAIRRPAGTQFTFDRTSRQSAYAPGEIVGYAETVTGSTTFLKAEQ